MKLLQSMIIAFSMYSKIPMPRIDWNKDNMKFSLCFFPFVGAVCGALILGWHYLSMRLGFGLLFRSVVFVLIPIIITGGIHFDGYLDTIDAISSYQTMERRLEILKDSNSGAFAIIYGLVYIMFAIGIYSEIDSAVAIKVFAVSFVFSRALSGYSVTSFKCAKNSGLAATFSNMSDKKNAGIVLLLESVLAAVLMIFIDAKCGLAAVFAGIISFVIYRKMSYKMFGGITGDLAGFFLQICELFMAFAVMVAT